MPRTQKRNKYKQSNSAIALARYDARNGDSLADPKTDPANSLCRSLCRTSDTVRWRPSVNCRPDRQPPEPVVRDVRLLSELIAQRRVALASRPSRPRFG